MGYIMVGTTIFLYLEAEVDHEARKALRQMRNDFLDANKCLGGKSFILIILLYS